MKVTSELRNALVRSAREEVDALNRRIESLRKDLQKAEDELKHKRDVLDWAQYLVLGADLVMNPPTNTNKPVERTLAATPVKTVKRLLTLGSTLYFIASRSGGQGHYIEKHGNNIWCSCLGFINRGYCWASNKIKNDQNTLVHLWILTRTEFDNRRSRALAAQGI
jgi:hypothetical protein